MFRRRRVAHGNTEASRRNSGPPSSRRAIGHVHADARARERSRGRQQSKQVLRHGSANWPDAIAASGAPSTFHDGRVITRSTAPAFANLAGLEKL
jgi:hypothetical protein